MKSLYRCLTAAALLLLIDPAMAQMPLPDWRFYTFGDTPKSQAVFFLYSGIVRSPKGHVQVWIKMLDHEKLVAVFNTIVTDRPDLVQRAKNSEPSYVPPYTTVKNLSPDVVVTVRVYEQLADEGHVAPTLRGLFEFDCEQKLYRELSAISDSGSVDEAQPWKHIPPESTALTLSKMVCQK